MTNRLTTEQLEAIRKRAEKATEGPWSVFSKDDERNIGTTWAHPQLRDSLPVVTLGVHVKEPHHRVYIKEADADFISAAREDIPLLLAEVERLRNAIDNAASLLPDGENRLANRYLCGALGVDEDHYGFFGGDTE